MKNRGRIIAGLVLGSCACCLHAQTATPGAPEDNGLTPKGPTVYVNQPPDWINNGDILSENTGIAIANNGNLIIGYEDDGDGVNDLEGVWTLLNSTGQPTTPDTTIHSLATGETFTSKLLSYFRKDGSATPGSTAWGPRLKANLFGDGIGMGANATPDSDATSPDGFNNEVPDLASYVSESWLGMVQLLTSDGMPIGILPATPSDYAARPGQIRMGDWDYLANSNIVIVSESRQNDDLANLYGGSTADHHGIYRILTPAGVEVKSTTLLSATPEKVEVFHGLGVTKNGFAVRFALNGAGTIRLFNNDGSPASTNIDLATLVTNSIVGGGGSGEGIGFHGNGNDAYVLATAGNDAAGQNHAWVTVINTNGTVRWTRDVSDDVPTTKVGNIDAAIDSSGRVVVIYDDSAAILGRAFDKAGKPLGGTFYVSENEPPGTSINSKEARVSFRGDLVAVVWGSGNDPSGSPVAAVRTFSLFKPGTLESVGLTRIVPDTPVITPAGDSLGNWEPYASVLGNGDFLVEANTFAQSETEWQRYVVAVQSVDGKSAKLIEGFYADDGTPYNGRINGSRQNGNPGRVAGDKRPGASNYMVGGETSVHAVPAFQSNNRWNTGFDYAGTALNDSNPTDSGIDRYGTVQTFKLDSSSLTATPLMKAADSANGRLTSGEPNHPQVTRFGGDLAGLDNGNFVSVVEDRSGLRASGDCVTATIFAPDGSIVKDSWKVADGDIWSNVAAYQGGFAVRASTVIYFFDNTGNLKGQINQNASGESFSTDRGDGTRIASHINTPFVFLAGQASGANLVKVAAFDSRDQTFAAKAVVSEPSFTGSADRSNLAVDALNRLAVGWVSQPTGYEQQQVAARILAFDPVAKSFSYLTPSFLPFINAAQTGGIRTLQMNLSMTTKQILVAAKGEINLENKPDQGVDSPKEINFYTVFSHPDPKEDPTTPAGTSGGGGPTLVIARSGANVTITWTASGFTLQSAGTLGGTVTWTDIATTGNTYTSAGIPGAAQFYRLHKP